MKRHSAEARPLKPASLYRVYADLKKRFGHQNWWPGETPFEVMVGAILTQNTAWSNVEKAIRNLKEKHALNPDKMRGMSSRRLAALIKPAGFFNVKTRRLKAFVRYFHDNYRSQIKLMKRRPAAVLRRELLAVHGIGEETADSILLYALNKSQFVIDAYTKRIFMRHRLNETSDAAGTSLDYGAWKNLFVSALPRSVKLYNDYHAQIVMLGKTYCKSAQPKCYECPLSKYL
ncbi:MAG: hypothetical protein A2Z83_09490 [Omnitrophica bacterium GWA2_52_8]|nr:MAG: hypothetical protein A2Z83_09490 [Omnitrophica bacterium GWA2_52_8]